MITATVYFVEGIVSFSKIMKIPSRIHIRTGPFLVGGVAWSRPANFPYPAPDC